MRKRTQLIGFTLLSIMLILYANSLRGEPQVINQSIDLGIVYPETPYIPEFESTTGIINTSGRNILYWIQISDIHTNMRHETSNLKFDQFCNDTASIILPAFVMDTGDSVDGSHEAKERFYQNESEYLFYNTTLQKYGFTDSNWFSIPGNHERYSTGLDWSFWKTYMRNETQYAFDIVTSFGKYRFVMMDTTLEVGAKRHFFCYFGEMKQDKLDHLEKLLDTGTEIYNQTIIAGHHPLNQIWSEKSQEGHTFSDLIEESGSPAYLTGHLHLADVHDYRGYTTELLCPGFKDTLMYRICAYDDDILSFSDVKVDEWPAMVVTTPTDDQYYNPQMPLDRMTDHTEIRALIFDPKPLFSVHAEVDGQVVGNLTAQGNNLWALTWDPTAYASGAHQIKVVASSASGTTVKQFWFNLEDFAPREQSWASSRIALQAPIITGLIALIIVTLLLSIGHILVPKLYYKLIKKKDLSVVSPRDYDSEGTGFFKHYFVKRWIQAAKLPRNLTIPLLIMPIFVLSGPLFLGDIAPGTGTESYGFLTLYRTFFFLGTYNLDIVGLILSLILLYLSINVGMYVVRGYENHIGFWARIPFVIYMAIVGYLSYFFGNLYGYWLLLVNPTFWIFVIIPLFLAIRTEQNQKKLKE